MVIESGTSRRGLGLEDSLRSYQGDAESIQKKSFSEHVARKSVAMVLDLFAEPGGCALSNLGVTGAVEHCPVRE